VRGLLGLREALAAESDRAVAALDLSSVWSGVDREIARAAEQAAWRRRVAGRRGAPRGLAWGAVAALAAGTLLFLRTGEGPQTPRVTATAPATQGPVAKNTIKRLPNHVFIDRLAGKDIALRREPKSGTTMIWVNHEVDRSEW